MAEKVSKIAPDLSAAQLMISSLKASEKRAVERAQSSSQSLHDAFSRADVAEERSRLLEVRCKELLNQLEAAEEALQHALDVSKKLMIKVSEQSWPH